jgi:enoyl-CoA hydratase/carnithine racemase
MYNISTLPQVTIGAVEGRARGGGNEFLVALDMRFATNDSIFGQPEVGLGFIPGGGGAQFLPGLIGRGQAMEYILTAKDINASEAEKIGWINKAFNTSAEMYAYIGGVSSRCRLFPLSALKAAKTSINLASAPSREDILHDALAFQKLSAGPESQAIQAKINAASANLTQLQVELNLGDFILRAYE